jgi:hypothetical protein
VPAQFVSARELERARRRGERLVPDPPEQDGPWLDVKSAEVLVSLFGRLSVRPGIRLVTYSARGGSGGNGWTFAIPVGARAPGAEELATGPDGFAPEPPPGALPHFMHRRRIRRARPSTTIRSLQSSRWGCRTRCGAGGFVF